MIPKIESLLSTLDEMEADVACVTETWLLGRHEKVCQDIVDRTRYGLIERNRQGRRGGGVCILYNKDHIHMTRCRLLDSGSNFEVVAAIGRRTRQRRKTLVISAYLPPKYTPEQNKNFLNYLCDCILTLKNRYSDPYIIIGGCLLYTSPSPRDS